MARIFSINETKLFKNKELIECPDCGFEFGAIHELHNQPLKYSCPLCELLEMEKEKEILKEALKYYDEDIHYKPYGFDSYGCDITEDGGIVARIALAKVEEND